jgi:type IV pilus assembly protein PilW
MKLRHAGFGLIELMIAMALGLLVVAGVLVVFIAQRQVYQNSNSQSLIQDADNAISAIVTPVVRGAGFTGCAAIAGGVKAYPGVRNTPLTFNTSSHVQGFDAKAIPSPLVDGAANDVTAGDWSPSLDTSFLSGNMTGIAPGSDVLVVIGAPPGAVPVGVTAFGTNNITVNTTLTTNSVTFTVPQLVAVSDCGKSSIFQVVTTGNAGTLLNYATGPNGTPLYPISSQIIPIQQTAFFVAKGDAGQSALFEAVMTIPAGGTAANAIWSKPVEVVPGVLNMQVLYGIGNGSAPPEANAYVTAPNVTNFSNVNTVKLGFLIEGNTSSSNAKTNQTVFPLFSSTLTAPADSRLRHTFSMTVNTRNSTLQ